MKRVFAILAMAAVLCGAHQVHAQELKVDFNVSRRGVKEVNERGYTPWAIDTVGTLSKTISGLEITLAKVGSVGTGLEGVWHKKAVQSPYFARLAGDVVRVRAGEAGAQMSMTLKGLKVGTHTIALFFNAMNGAADDVAPIDIYVDEAHKAKVKPSSRALKNIDAAYAYLTFSAAANKDVVIRMAAVTTGAEKSKNVPLCGFELNFPDMKMQIRNPYPADFDEHIDADSDTVKLMWQAAAAGADSYNVYLGTNAADVENTSKTSPAFRGNQTATNYTLSDVKRMNSYYWRIDVVKNGVTTKGKLLFFRPRVLAFAGAEGYGRFARGGRGGKVVYVTNLNNSGEGSLREATKSDIGARYIVFAVSGRIHHIPKERIVVSNDYITVAGQTAPGKGICVSGTGYGITGNDVVVRFMRVRVGQFGVTLDGMGMTGANHSILDHSSISWTHDEAFSSRGGKNFTLQNTLIAEALNAAGHSVYRNRGRMAQHGYAATIGGDTASFLRNLLAHNEGRNWSLGGGLNGDGYYWGHLDITNNVVFNYGNRVTDGGAYEVNFVNNYYKQGVHSVQGLMLKAQHEGVGKGTQKYYYRGNVLEAYDTVTKTYSIACDGVSNLLCGYKDEWSKRETQYVATVDKPFFANYATVLTAKHAYKNVISNSGANMPMLDEHDDRVVLEARDGKWKYKGSVTGKWGIPDHHLDVGGYENYDTITLNLDEFDTDRDGLPNWWEEEVSKTNPKGAVGDFTNTNTEPDNDGMTHMERYLEFMATPNFATKANSAIAIELSQYTRGYTKSPVYSVVTNGDGAVVINGNYARFTPAADFKGVTYFTFKVKDADGDEMTRKVAVRVSE